MTDRWVAGAVIALLPASPLAEPALPALAVTTGVDGQQTWSISVQVLLLMTVLGLLPAALIMMTSFTRIVVVLAILRQALGTTTTPSNQILLGLALFLTGEQDLGGEDLRPADGQGIQKCQRAFVAFAHEHPRCFASPERVAREMRAPHPPPGLATIRTVVRLV